MSIMQDIKAAVKLTGEIRKARKAGADAVQIRPVYNVPALKTSYWVWTMEACLMYGGETERAVVAVFEALPEPVQHSLTFSPQDRGEWIDRARFWRRQLEPVLPPKMYHSVMTRLIGWYAHCLRQRQEVAV